MSSQNQRLHALVIGRVQGVGFRYFVMGAAGDLAVTGWVRNRREGHVEVIAEGEKEKLDNLLLVLQRGSRSSLVKEVKENWQNYTGEFQGFSVRATL
ncbi:MAG: acylphosphatase [Anaerolineales bacterium]|nr:acylphosphatase [Anaerolineales bacterium]